jgi:hypothetical protein
MAKANSKRTRIQLEKRYRSHYKPHFLNDLGLCVYCGQKKEQLDHCPPLAWMGAYGSEYFISKKIPILLVAACRDCNQILSDHPYFTVRQRKGYIAASLREKFAKELQNPMWIADEIGELGRGLRDFVNDRQGIRLILERRLDYAISD